ncbi:LppM family (lipo)protein [Gordonia caeni]|uniref:LppM family (lipo)protein n=1 Tax=Gordonia caeni TaxID=1007097 RepID=UPI0031D336F2
MPSLHRPQVPRRLPALACVALLALIPLLSGCMTRSEHVGDQFSGFVVVAATPEASPAAPTFDVPASMSGSVSVTPFPNEWTSRDAEDEQTSTTGKVGSRMTYTDLTAGQFSQLGEIISSALDSGATVDLNATRSGDIVRLRGGAALTALPPNTYYLSITVDFDGPVVATNGNLAGDSSVTWVPEPEQNAEFNADAEYPDPATAALPGWTWFVVLLCLAIVAVVAATAYRLRDKTPRYTPPADQKQTAVPAALAGLGKRVRRRKSDSAAGGEQNPEAESAQPGAATSGEQDGATAADAGRAAGEKTVGEETAGEDGARPGA